jgi:hypothetical protein
MRRIKKIRGRDRNSRKAFIPYVFFVSIFSSLPLVGRKREREKD